MNINILDSLLNAAKKSTAAGLSKNSVVKAANLGGTASRAAVDSSGRALSGVGGAELGKGTGSTLEGILSNKSGVKLPNAKQKSIKDITGDDTIEALMSDSELTTKDLKNNLSSKNYKRLKDAASEAKSIKEQEYEGQNTTGVKNKSNLPKLNREEYYYDTIGSLKKGNVTSEDVPSYMKNKLSNKLNDGGISRDNDSILREFFGETDNPNVTKSDLYDRYHKLAEKEGNASKTMTPENIGMGLDLDASTGGTARKDIERDFVDNILGKKEVKVEGETGKTEKIDVNTPTTAAEQAEAVAPVTDTEVAGTKAEQALAENTAETAPEALQATKATNKVDTTGTEGFNIPLGRAPEQGETFANYKVKGATGQEKALYRSRSDAVEALNPSKYQRENLKGKSGSVNGYYQTVADRIIDENITQANVESKVGEMLAGRSEIVNNNLQQATDAGLTIDLSDINKVAGLRPGEIKRLQAAGRDALTEMGGQTVYTPVEAEDLYKYLRDSAVDMLEKSGEVNNQVGRELMKQAKAVKSKIDEVMDANGYSGKDELVEFMAANKESPKYRREISKMENFKFSDLRKDQADLIKIAETAGNKRVTPKTINVMGVETGIDNPIPSVVGAVKDKYNKARAGSEKSLVSKALPYAGAALGGLLLSNAGGGSNSETGTSTLGNTLAAQNTTQANSKGTYSTATLGGYTMDDLEQGYVNAIKDGNTDAAEVISDMITTLQNKIDNASSSSSSDSKTTAAISTLQELYGLYNNIQSGTGPIGGTVTNIGNFLTGGSYNTEANTYWSMAQGSLGRLIKGMGETGTLSDQDQARALQMIPTVTDSQEAAEAKFQALYQILSAAGSQ